MYCSYCGAKIPDGHRFCGMCGELVIRSQASEGNRRPPQREAPPANVTVMPREVQRPVPLAEVLAEKEAAEKRRQEREPERYVGEAPRTVAPPPPPPPRNDLPAAHLGGPSFLGLSDPAPAQPNTDYLLEDDDYRPRRSYGRFMLLLLILAVFAGLGYLQWRKIQGQPLSPLAGQVEDSAAEPTEQSAAPEVAAEASTPQTPADSAAAHPASQTPPANPEVEQAEPAPGEPPAAAATPRSEDDGARADDDDAARAEAEPESQSNANPEEPEKPAATVREQADPEIDSAAGDRELELGRAYLSGRYGDRDPSEAAKWLWRAVSKGNTDASLALADLYLSGEGVEKNCDQARVLLTAAARKGNSDAASKLRTLECGA